MGERIYMSVEIQESNGVNESMARSGVSLRGDNRGYLQSDFGVLDNLSVIRRANSLAERVIAQQRRGITRTVGRFLVPEGLLPAIARDDQLRGVVETVFPTSLRLPQTGERVMVLMGARNHRSRTSSVPVSEMTRLVQADQDYRRMRPINLAERIENLRRQGYRFISQIPQEFVPVVHNLWRSTFGWELQGVATRALDLERQSRAASREKTVWFSGLINPQGDLVAVATAERADMRVGNGLPAVPLVETSEWSSRDPGKGYMAATNAHISAQILEDLSGVLPSPTIFAETNFTSRAHRVGLASGMEVAPRNIHGLAVPQILQQHVTVGDGHIPEGLRSFTPMFVSDEAKAKQFNPEARQIILSHIKPEIIEGGSI